MYLTAGCLYNSDTAVKLAKLANEASNVEFQGLYVHCGNTYQQDPAKRVELQAQTTDRLLELKNRYELYPLALDLLIDCMMFIPLPDNLNI